MTVRGPISLDELGITLAHEHIMIDLTCWYQEPIQASQKSYANEHVTLDNLWRLKQNLSCNKENMMLQDAGKAAEEVMEFKRFGGGSIVDVTNIGIGRDPISLRNISIETGVNVIMGAGYYVSNSHPPDMDDRSEEEIAVEIISDVTKGVGKTGIKAGIIGEIGLSDIESLPNEEKVLRAAVTAQKETGAALTLHPATHTISSDGCHNINFKSSSERIIEVLEEEGADMKGVIMGHSELYMDDTMEHQFMTADTGMFIEYDTWGFEGNWPRIGLVEPSDTQRLNGIIKLLENGYQDQLLLSQDVCNKIQLMAYGGFGYAHILRDCMPLFRKASITEEEIQKMLVDNPKRILRFK